MEENKEIIKLIKTTFNKELFEYRKRMVLLLSETVIANIVFGAGILLVGYDYGRSGMHIVLICMILFNIFLFSKTLKPLKEIEMIELKRLND